MKMFDAKKLVGLVVAGLFFVACQVSAYTHKIINTTEYQVTAHLNYVACSDDYRVIEAGKSINNDAKGCILKEISATVAVTQLPQSALDVLNTFQMRSVDATKFAELAKSKNVETKFNYNGPYTGSATWIIYGSPAYGFGVTRKVD